VGADPHDRSEDVDEEIQLVAAHAAIIFAAPAAVNPGTP
jgi:hypothetical protein